MVKILILLIVVTNIYSKSDFSDYFKVEQSLKVQTKTIYFKDSDYIADDKINAKQLIYINKTNFNYKNLLISSRIFMFQNSKEYDAIDLYGSYKKHDKKGINVSKLYAKYTFTFDNFDVALAYGVIPFTGGNFKQYSNQDLSNGNGLFTMVNVSLLGKWIILTNKDKTTSLTIGDGEWKKDSIYSNNQVPDIVSKSKGIYGSFEHNIETINTKHIIQLDYYDAKAEYSGQNVLNSDMYGIGYSLESYKYEIVLYTILTYNKINIDNPFIKLKLYGHSELYGIKKYFDVVSQEFDIGYEYFFTSANTIAGAGEFYTNDYSHSLLSKMVVHKVYSDFVINNDIIFSVNYVNKTYLNNDALFKREYSIQTGITYKF